MSDVVKTLARRSPNWLYQFVKSSYIGWSQSRIRWAVNRYDRAVYREFQARGVSGATLIQLEGKLTFHAHALEKGLSHTQMRPQFGVSALTQLAEVLHEYRRLGLPADRLPYVNALSTLNAYVSAHRDSGADWSHLSGILGQPLMREVAECASGIGGVTRVTAEEKSDNRQKNFADLFRGRYSVREFARRGISRDRIMPAIELAMKSPSVCNRQSSRVAIVTDHAVIGKVLSIQGGMTGYPLPPAVIVLTAELESFLAPTERNQAFVDGGLYAMSLLLALEFEGVAACPLNAMMTPDEEKSIQRLLGLPRSHRIIVFVAVGEFPDEVKVPKSFRAEGRDIVTSSFLGEFS